MLPVSRSVFSKISLPENAEAKHHKPEGNDDMSLLKRTVYCGEPRIEQVGGEIIVNGWVQKRRDLGSLIFIDLRDRTGIVQLVFDTATRPELLEVASSLRAEYVIAAKGMVRERSNKNPKMPTGDVEVEVSEMQLLSRSETPPFEVSDNAKVGDDVRLKYRYLDLRRPSLQRNLMLRSKAAMITRNYYEENGFVEIETPVLIKSTPEGARDYLVPSRVHPGSFYALPQSPQLYKQILMLSGFDRYVQIARCFRDEDLRADRQPEFTQIDVEMSFVDMDDVMGINEGFMKKLFQETIGVEIETPFQRMTWREAMDRFGSDKPDLRFGFELKNITDVVKNSEFKVFQGAISMGGSVRCINVKGGADKFTRKEIDALGEFAKTYRAKGLAWIKLGDTMSSSFAKFISEEELSGILAAAEAEQGDLIFVVADKDKVVFDSLGALRCECAKRLGLLKKDDFKFLWVTEFPLFEYDEEAGRYSAVHHPFTSPMLEDIPLLDTDLGKVRAIAYDTVLNGVEVGGGSMRIHDSALQAKMFELLDISEEQAQLRFGFLLNALKYGTPPHGGLAYGFDRLIMLLVGEDSIRDVIAFPKVQNASELMSGAPEAVDPEQLEELYIKVDISENN